MAIKKKTSLLSGSTPKERKVVELLAAGGLSYRAIGKRVGLSHGRVGQLAEKYGFMRRFGVGPLVVCCQHCGKPTPLVLPPEARPKTP